MFSFFSHFVQYIICTIIDSCFVRMTSAPSFSDGFADLLCDIFGSPSIDVNSGISAVLDASDISKVTNKDNIVAFFINQFDLSLFDLAPVVKDALSGEFKFDSIKITIYELENAVEIFQFAFWKVFPSEVLETIFSMCRQFSDLSISARNFSVIRLLRRRHIALLHVFFVALKEAILHNSDHFWIRGFNVVLA